MAAGVAAIGLLVWAVAEDSVIAVIVAFALVVSVGLFLVPKLALAVIGAFLLTQPALANLAGGTVTTLGATLHRLHEVFAVAAAIRVAAMLWWDRLKAPIRPWFWFTVVFATLGVISGIVQQVPILTLARGTFLAVTFPLFLLLAMTIHWSDRDSARIMKAALWLGPLLVASGLLIWMMPAEVQDIFVDHTLESESFGRGQFAAMQGIFSHPGMFGWAAAVTGCYAVAALLTGRRSWNMMAGGSLVASVVGILASLRRKPLIALPVVAVFGIVRFGRGWRRWAVLALFVLVGWVAARIAIERLDVEYEDAQVYVDPTGPLAPRVLLYTTGVEIANTRFPLGAGFGRFGGYASIADYSPLYDEYGLSGIYGLGSDNPYYIEDTYWPHLAAETGWFGAIVVFGFYLLLAERTARVASRTRDQATHAVAIAACLALLEGLLESGAGPVFEEALFAFAVAIPIGIVLTRVGPGPEPAPVLPPTREPGGRLSRPGHSPALARAAPTEACPSRRAT